jgi:hypothetical protein
LPVVESALNIAPVSSTRPICCMLIVPAVAVAATPAATAKVIIVFFISRTLLFSTFGTLSPIDLGDPCRPTVYAASCRGLSKIL